MNWDAIAAVGQLLGSVAVFITLGYLAVQVRHAREAGQRALSQGRGEALRQVLAQQSDPRVSTILTKTLTPQLSGVIAGFGEKFGLTRDEAFLVGMHFFSWWNYQLQVIPYVDELPPIERVAFDSTILTLYGTPGLARDFYEASLKPGAHADAVRYVDNLLTQRV